MPKDKDPQTGKFLPGHKVNKKDPDLKALQKQGGYKFLKKFDSYLNMPLAQLKTYTQNESRFTGLDAIIIQFMKKAMEEGDVQRLKLIMTRYGLPTELKAVAVQGFDEDNKPLTLEETIHKARLVGESKEK